MSRLESHRNKRFFWTIIFFLFLLGTLFFFIFTYGIKMLLSASLFVADLTGQNTSAPALSKESNFIGTVQVDDIPSATNSSRIMISGSVLNFDILDFYINDAPVKETSLIASDNFNEEVGDLTVGQNQVFVIAKSKDSHAQKKSNLYTVTYQNTPPKLEISAPSDKSKTNKQDLAISGLTDKEVFVKVNDAPVVVDAKGNFQTSIKLQNGDNRITIIATDIAGNSTTQTLTVTYQND